MTTSQESADQGLLFDPSVHEVRRHDGVAYLANDTPDSQPEPYFPQSATQSERELTETITSVAAIDRAQHLINALDLIAGAKKRAGFAAHKKSGDGKRELSHRYGPWLDNLAKGVAFNKSSDLKQYREEFAAAYGHPYPAKVGSESPADLEPEFKKDLINFYKEFFGSSDVSAAVTRKKRDAFRRQLAKRIIEIQAYAPLEIAQEELTHLTTQEKLQALLNASGAKFLATTNFEKNAALELQDYTKDENGVANRLSQIHDFQVKAARKRRDDMKAKGGLYTRDEIKAASHSTGVENGHRATRSVVNSWCDFYESASRDYAGLVGLSQLLEGFPNQRIALAEIEEIDTTHPGYAALMRYIDVLMVAENGSAPAGFDPLLTRFDRTTPIVPRAGLPPQYQKNKVVGDEYTAPATKQHIDERIKAFLATANKQTIRNYLDTAIEDQARRKDHWQRILLMVKGPTKRIARASLEQASTA